MLRYRNKGYTIELDLPADYGYKGYSVECTYKYNKRKEKYLLSMWLKRATDRNKYRIESQEIDTQYISGARETIIDNICRIVEQASISGFFDPYIKEYEHTYKCFTEGEKLLESERADGESA